jgi:hypothetical protein
LGAFATGYLYDISGNYRRAFVSLAVIHLTGALAVVPLGRMRRPNTGC